MPLIPALLRRATRICLLGVISAAAASAAVTAPARPQAASPVTPPGKVPATQPAQWPGQLREFRSLLGKPIDSPEVKPFVAKHALKCHQKFDSGGYSGDQVSFSLLFRENKICRVILGIARSKDAEGTAPLYQGDLPMGIHRGDSPEDVIRKLGKPTHQPERSHLSYDSLGLVISFLREDLRLCEVCLDAPE